MRRRAVSEGDQAYGAIVAKNGQVVGLGPSRVVTNTDADRLSNRRGYRALRRH